jgi:hypothetical protein
MSKPRPIEITISVYELQHCYRHGFKGTGDMLLHILRAAGFRFEPAQHGKPPEMCGRWERWDDPRGITITFRQWPDAKA